MARGVYQAARTMRDVGGAESKSRQLLRGLVEQEGKQKSKMTEEFEKQLSAAQSQMEAALAIKHKKKGGALGDLAPALLGLIGGPVGPILAGLVSGAKGITDVQSQQKHEEDKIALARQFGLDPRWGKTFLGSGAREFKGKKQRMLDDLLRKTDVSGKDLLMTGVMKGFEGYGGGKMLQGFKGGLGPKFEVDPTKTIPGSEVTLPGGEIMQKLPTVDLDNLIERSFGERFKGGMKGLTKGFGEFQDLFNLEEGGGGLQALLALLAPGLSGD